MDAEARKNLAADFIDHCTHKFAWDADMVLRKQSLHPEVLEAVDELSRTDPDEFLKLVLEIIHASQDGDVMMHISAPLYFLLDARPGRIINQVEALAGRDPIFRELLGWFIPSEPHNETWTRIRKVAGTVPW